MSITHTELGSLFDCSQFWDTDNITHYCNRTASHDGICECGCGECRDFDRQKLYFPNGIDRSLRAP